MASNQLKNSRSSAMKAALFLDFDNFFSGLMSADPTSALALVTDPSLWLNKLVTSYTDGADRRWLVLRCYMNPAGSIADPHKEGERLLFSNFRPFFTRAGVEVVDCPAVTRGAKNGADIRIAIDVMTALKSNVKYDEFVIASADADFTPLLQVLRAEDRMVTVIATVATSAAYESLADRLLDEKDIFALIASESPKNTESAKTPATPHPEKLSPEVKATKVKEPGGSQHQNFEKAARRIYSRSKTPISLSLLGSEIRATPGIGALDGQWFGAKSFVRAIKVLELPNAKFSQHYLWDSTRHEAPTAITAGKTPAVSPPSVPVTVPTREQPSIPATVMHYSKVTGMPKIASNDWPFVYQTLADHAALHLFNLAESTKWSRDQAIVAGRGISRRTFTFVVYAILGGGTDLDADPSPDAADISRAVFISVLQRAELAGLEVNESAKRELAKWLHCEDTEFIAASEGD